MARSAPGDFRSTLPSAPESFVNDDFEVPVELNNDLCASRSNSYHRCGLCAIMAKNGGAFPMSVKPAAVAEPKFYPTDDVKPRTVSTHKPKPTKLRCARSLPASLDPVCEVF
jgi:hypothetical protein